MNHDQKAKAMTDAALLSEENRLKKVQSQACSMLSAIRRERRHRSRNAKKASHAG